MGPCFIRPCIRFVRPFMPRAGPSATVPGVRWIYRVVIYSGRSNCWAAPAWQACGDMRTTEFVPGLTQDFIHANQSTSSGQMPMKSRKIM